MASTSNLLVKVALTKVSRTPLIITASIYPKTYAIIRLIPALADNVALKIEKKNKE